MINTILHENSCLAENSFVTEILSGGNIIHYFKEIVSKFNDFLVNIGPNLAKKITPGNPNSSITDKCQRQILSNFLLLLALAMKYKQWLPTCLIVILLELMNF